MKNLSFNLWRGSLCQNFSKPSGKWKAWHEIHYFYLKPFSVINVNKFGFTFCDMCQRWNHAVKSGSLSITKFMCRQAQPYLGGEPLGTNSCCKHPHQSEISSLLNTSKNKRQPIWNRYRIPKTILFFILKTLRVEIHNHFWTVLDKNCIWLLYRQFDYNVGTVY